MKCAFLGCTLVLNMKSLWVKKVMRYEHRFTQRFSWIMAKKSEFQIYQLKSSKMFSHHTKFEEMVFQMIWNWNFSRLNVFIAGLLLDVVYLMMLNVGTKQEVCRFNRNKHMDNRLVKLKWRHTDVIAHLIFIKFKCESNISKRNTKFHFDRT